MAVRMLMVVALLSVAACAPEPAAACGGDGELVLELGGGNRSLAASLRGLGVSLLPPRSFAGEFALDAQAPGPADVPPSESSPRSQSSPPSSPAGTEAVTPPAPAPTPDGAAPQWFEVRLEPRQTLVDLARKHLGSGSRYQEILQLNGWSEADARRLKSGQKVKIPKSGT